MAGFACPCCGQTAPLFPSAPGADSIWAEITKLASLPFSPKAAAGADQGLPVMISRSSPEQTAAFESAAAQVQQYLD